MRLQSQSRDGISILRLQGRFVTGTETDLAAARKLLEEAGASRVVIDLGSVPYIDSTGLAFVVELHSILARSGGQLFLARANQRVREVLDLTRIAEVVPVFADVEDAENALRGEVLC